MTTGFSAFYRKSDVVRVSVVSCSRTGHGALLGVLLLFHAAGAAAAASQRVAVAWNDPALERGVARAIGTSSPWVFVTPPLEVGLDSVLRFYRGTLYAVSRSEGTIHAIDAEQWTVLHVYELEAASDLRDIAVVGSRTAYITRGGATHLLRLDLASGETAEVVDLSLFADGDGVPDLDRMAVFEERLFVQIRREVSDTQSFLPPPLIAVVDLATEELVDTDSARPGVQAIELAGTAPKLKMQVLAASRRLVVGATGVFHDHGGIEVIDLDSLVSEGIAISEIGEFTGPEIGAFILTRTDRGYLTFSTDLIVSSHMKGFTLAAGVDPPPDLETTLEYTVPALAHDPRTDALFLPVGAAGVAVFDAGTGARLTPEPVATGGAPTDIELLCDDPLACSPRAGGAFRRADANGDGSVDMSDGIFSLNFLFFGARSPGCLDASDANDDARVDLSDAVYTFGYLVLGGPAPPAPGPAACGFDPTADRLDCRHHDPCLPREGPAYRLVVVEPPGGDEFAAPLGMNERGIVVGYSGPEQWSPLSRPLRVALDNATAEWLEVPEARFGFAHDAGDDGHIVVGEYDWRPSAWVGRTRIMMQVPEGYFSGIARAVHESGLVVGSFADYDDPIPPNPVGPRACYWPDPASPPVALRTLFEDEPVGSADAVNDAGQIAGALATPDGHVVVRWEAPDAAPVAVGGLADPVFGESRAINSRGDIAVRGFAGEQSRAVLAPVRGAPVALPSLPGADGYSEAFDLDDFGRVVGTARAADGTAHAVLWHEGAALDLNEHVVDAPAAVKYLSAAVGIDASGRIAVEVVLDDTPGRSAHTVGILVPVFPLRSGNEP